MYLWYIIINQNKANENRQQKKIVFTSLGSVGLAESCGKVAMRCDKWTVKKLLWAMCCRKAVSCLGERSIKPTHFDKQKAKNQK